MTEFEAATIAYQNSSLDLQLYAIYAQVGAGLWMMHHASKERNNLMDEDRGRADKRHQEAMDNIRTRHEEAMTALKELIARTAPPSPPSASPAG